MHHKKARGRIKNSCIFLDLDFPLLILGQIDHIATRCLKITEKVSPVKDSKIETFNGYFQTLCVLWYAVVPFYNP